MESITKAQNRLEITMDGKNGFFRGVLWAQRWISVEDELPQKGLYVLVKTEFTKAKYEVAYFNGIQFVKEVFRSEMIYVENIKYWRPIEIN